MGQIHTKPENFCAHSIQNNECTITVSTIIRVHYKAGNITNLPSCLFSEGICSSMGWGSNSEDETGQNIMKQVKLNRVTDRAECEKAIKNSNKVKNTWTLDASWICARESEELNNDNVLCKGDGGGPLVCQEHGTNR